MSSIVVSLNIAPAKLLSPFRLNSLSGLYLAIGIMVPIRLGTVGILRLMVDLHQYFFTWSFRGS
jgi:hypothetical protein